MSDTEKQEGQKTVVAFIAGLLIGGLLVWVFSSSPANAPINTTIDDKATTESTSGTTGDVVDTTPTSDSSDTTSINEEVAPEVVTADATIAVSNQAAGTIVELGDIAFPTNDGWIAVRDYKNGEVGRILGASRYSLDVNLIPTNIQLLRATEPGMTYKVVFHTESGDRVFDPAEDQLLEEYGTTFTAQ